MHKSQLAGICIDCKDADPDEAAQFWSAALGCKAQTKSQANDPIYRSLDTGRDDLYIEVQHVEHDSRVHLDIESDDIEAEAQRLESLGATRIGVVKEWIVMQAPTGQRFCVVTPQSTNFAETATEW